MAFKRRVGTCVVDLSALNTAAHLSSLKASTAGMRCELCNDDRSSCPEPGT